MAKPRRGLDTCPILKNRLYVQRSKAIAAESEDEEGRLGTEGGVFVRVGLASPPQDRNPSSVERNRSFFFGSGLLKSGGMS